MRFVPEKAVKEQAIADFLADYPVPKNCKPYEIVPNEAMTMNITSQNEVW